MASVGESFFEGAEKLLEIWFSFKRNSDFGDLRSIKRNDWEGLLKIVQCEIISFTCNEDMDAYVLSESSMFITKDRFILKTCGKTTLLHSVKPLLKLVEEKCGIEQILDIFYSRKNFTRPDLQIGLHKNFSDEVSHLDDQFRDGAAYSLGRINKDCWYLYTLDRDGVTKPDQTFELLMWDMCPEKMKIFTMDVSKNGQDARNKSGIIDIIPGAQIDDYLFEPCGYSMNGLLLGGYYITIHVTPETDYSYVSFESNVPKESYDELVKKVLSVFCPGKFLMTIFANKASVAKDCHKELLNSDYMEGYQRLDQQFCIFKNYNLTYTLFERPIL